MAKLVTRGLPAVGVLAVLVLVSTFGAGVFPAADRSATVLLGDQAVGPYRNHLRAGLAHAFVMRARGSGLAGEVRIYLGSDSGARAVAVGIYSDVNGHPGLLLSRGFDATPKGLAWGTVPITSMRVVSGHTYWFAVLGEGGTLRFRAGRGGSCSSSPSLQSDLHELPRRWSSGRVRVRTHCPISAYVLAAPMPDAAPAFGPSASVPSDPPAAPSIQPGATSPSADPTSSKEEKQKEGKANKEEKAEEEKIDEEKKTGTPKHCFENPETEGATRFEACGYPGPKNAGIAENGARTECSALPEYKGSRSIGTAKTTIEGKLVKIDLGSGESGFDVNAAEVTFNKDCLLVTGGGREGPAIDEDEHGSGLLVENSTIRAEGPKLPYSYEKAVDNSRGIGPGWKIENTRIEDCGECVSGFGELSKSYVISNEYVGEESHGLHREDWYLNDETASVRESTMFNPSDQTSDIFMDSNDGAGGIECDDRLTVEGSLLAGGGTSIEMCGKEDTAGTSSLTFTNNRVPRCLTKPIVKNSGGEEDCSGPYFEGGDEYGYMPHGGADGVAAFEDVGSVTWSGNYWDDDLAVLAKP
jgi:hypothetical protein